KNALSLFMDPTKSSQVEWLPSPAPPRRYFDISVGCCLTVQDGLLQKVTLTDDPTGLPYLKPKAHGFTPCDRTAQVVKGKIIIKDREQETVVPTTLPHECREEPGLSAPMSPIDWRSLFFKGVPPIASHEAYSAVALYPEDDTEIDELATQPFVVDYLEDLS